MAYLPCSAYEKSTVRSLVLNSDKFFLVFMPKANDSIVE